ncbi:hypothetical protein ACAF76_005060 [Brevibacillus sp. TJ4]|uniref:hypothetical protein n=1 Tax=Brevibacillus sp. TJ4 TaxID=3234853 RepID=UPI0037D69849
MSPTISMTLGVILGLAGFGMLIYLVVSSPIRKKNRDKLRKQMAEKQQSEKW